MSEQKKPAKFTFKHDGKTYTLPPASDGAGKVPGGVVQDLLMNPTRTNQLALWVHMLDASTASEAAKEALRAMPWEEMQEVLSDWMGESERSSQ